MRKLPTDKNGVELTLPQVAPDLNQRQAGGQTTPLITQVRRYELITPLFGGGVEPGVADPVMVIRGSEIRGHLRFWWRACRGGQFGGSLTRMKEAEDLLWGAASTAQRPRPSQVQIKVEMNNAGESKHPFVVVAGKPDNHGKPRPKLQAQESVSPAYASFPLQPTDEEIKKGGIGIMTKSILEGVSFTLTLTFPQSRQAEVEAALWAWETFGGIGARTRRGFGALQLVSVNGTPVQLSDAGSVEASIRSGFQTHIVTGTWPNGVPHLSTSPRMKITAARQNARAAWEYLIRRLKDFRQSRNPGMAPNRPGRSKWPEPDEIRRLTKRSCPKHATPLSTVSKFPRAAFGLPIVFHFKRDDVGDPDDTMLQGRDHDRLASPLIVRPLACANGQAVGLALILEGTGVTSLPGGLMLKDAPHNPTVQATLTSTEASSISPLGGNVDVLQAFLNTL